MPERTLIILKPDAVARGLVGETLARFERRSFRITHLKMMRLSREVAEELYAPHRGKSFFPALISFMTSGPVVAAIIEGEGVLRSVRLMMGETDPLNALPGTIRGDYATDITRNIIHAADSEESFRRESKLIFPELWEEG
jgi:nucleoside-diphosphate kinase